MRPDDHQAIGDRATAELVFPNNWDQPNNAAIGPITWIPAKDCLPSMDPKLVGRVKK